MSSSQERQNMEEVSEEKYSIGMLFNSQQDEDIFFNQMSIEGESMKGLGRSIKFEENDEILTTVYLLGDKNLNIFHCEEFAQFAVDSKWIYPEFIRQGDREPTDKTLMFEFAKMLYGDKE